jgi:hypothetical protein
MAQHVGPEFKIQYCKKRYNFQFNENINKASQFSSVGENKVKPRTTLHLCCKFQSFSLIVCSSWLSQRSKDMVWSIKISSDPEMTQPGVQFVPLSREVRRWVLGHCTCHDPDLGDTQPLYLCLRLSLIASVFNGASYELEGVQKPHQYASLL